MGTHPDPELTLTLTLFKWTEVNPINRYTGERGPLLMRRLKHTVTVALMLSLAGTIAEISVSG